MTKEYVCECGKTYTNPQSYNGHKRHCKTHLLKSGKLDKLLDSYKRAALHTSQTQKRQYQEKKQKELNQWISEKHTCEKCGKVMTEKFGSGRFCSKSCANGHKKSDESKIKVSETLRGYKLSNEQIKILLSPKPTKVKEQYVGPELPELEKEILPPGFFPRDRLSYAEKFWKVVFDNNQISYHHDFVVHKPKGGQGVYRLDFLIDNFDIEIDGEQHLKQDVKEKDHRRDEYLKSLGYIIYRIKWVNPYNDKNKKIVNQQIEDLFKFINKPRLV